MREEVEQDRSSNVRQLVLGLDARCFSCSDLEIRIEERTGNKLSVRDLRDPKVQGWRAQALGEDNVRAPTLFEVEDGEVRAWSGWRMGWVISRTVGPSAAWQVMQALVEAGLTPEIEGSALDGKPPEGAGPPEQRKPQVPPRSG